MCKVSKILAAIGAINWGLVGALEFDLVAWLAGAVGAPVVATIVYIIVGIAGLATLAGVVMCCAKGCSKGSCSVKK